MLTLFVLCGIPVNLQHLPIRRGRKTLATQPILHLVTKRKKVFQLKQWRSIKKGTKNVLWQVTDFFLESDFLLALMFLLLNLHVEFQHSKLCFYSVTNALTRSCCGLGWQLSSIPHLASRISEVVVRRAWVESRNPRQYFLLCSLDEHQAGGLDAVGELQYKRID